MTDDRTQCPACQGFSIDVTRAVTRGEACPHCDFPTAAFRYVADARSRGVRPEIIDALVEFGRERERTTRYLQTVINERDHLAGEDARHRARISGLHAEIDQLRAAQVNTIDRLRQDLRETQWRLDKIREGVTGYLDAPVPEHVKAST